ncbi:uncharacterized protein C05D11.13 isoform X2 [Thrips palmi]|nr:uncharacterized protein C05D11.13 isoform X2 [Thrips palmi]XP_034235359.1 uncharacterized protein C05D11.13 isoform X2 [Thrips palmi]
MDDPNKTPTLMWSAGPTVEPPKPSIIARRIRNAASMQAARARETPEGCAARREQNAARMEVLRARETAEQAADRRARNAIAMQAARARESPDQAVARRAQNAARMNVLRAKETPEQHAARKALNAKRMQASRAKDALQETASTVGLSMLMHDDVMRNAVLATHRRPVKKRKDNGDSVIIMDLDKQESQEHVVDLTRSSEGGVLENREGSSKFTFHVN